MILPLHISTEDKLGPQALPLLLAETREPKQGWQSGQQTARVEQPPTRVAYSFKTLSFTHTRYSYHVSN